MKSKRFSAQVKSVYRKTVDVIDNATGQVIGKAVVLGSTLAPALAFADDTIDTTAIIAKITAVGVAIGVVGAAVLGIHYGAKAYKWIRQAG